MASDGAAGDPASASTAAGGTIADLFTSLRADEPPMPPRFADLKERIRPDPQLVRDSWERLSAAIEEKTAAMAGADPEDIIPVVDFEEVKHLAALPQPLAERIRDVGTAVIRNTVPEEEAVAWREATKAYLRQNPNHTGFPEDNPQVYEIYWAKAELEARQHGNMLHVGRLLNGLWHGSDGAASTPAFAMDSPITYVDRLRMRNPGDTSFALGAHMDGGGIERWECAGFRDVYRHILDGDWEKFDAFCLDHRDQATSDMYETPNACSVFRTFQGWLSLSNTGPTQGTLRVVPFLREATAYMMLRPFLDDVPATDFPGARPKTTQDVNTTWHAPLVDAVTSIPAVKPGDTVWWHGDVIHAVEFEHQGTEDACVFYIPLAPMCRQNAEYLVKQRDHFLRGLTPPDFPPNHSEVDFVGRGTADDLTEAGKRAMGLLPFDATADASDDVKQLLQECNAILGYGA